MSKNIHFLSNSSDLVVSKQLETVFDISFLGRLIAMCKNDISFEIGCRWAAALKKRFPEKNRVKLVACSFDVNPITARSWLQGQAPYCKYIFLAGQKFGASFVAEIFLPDSAWLKKSVIDEALCELENKVCQLSRLICRDNKNGGRHE